MSEAPNQGDAVRTRARRSAGQGAQPIPAANARQNVDANARSNANRSAPADPQPAPQAAIPIPREVRQGAPPANPYQLTRLVFQNMIGRIAAETEGEGFRQQSLVELTASRERLVAATEKFQEQHLKVMEFGGIDEQAFAGHEQIFIATCQLAAEAQNVLTTRIAELQPVVANPAPPTVHVALNTGDSLSEQQSGSKFDGDMAKWVSFRDKFLATVHNNDNVAPVVKLEKLRKSLSGYAASVVGSRDPTEAGYEGAWQRLCKIFDDHYANTQAIIDTVVNLPKMSVASNEGIRKLVDTVHDATRQLHVLGEDVDHWDSILMNLIVRCLDTQTCGAWELKRGADVPTLELLCDWLDQMARSLMRNQPERTERSEKPNQKRKHGEASAKPNAAPTAQSRPNQSSGAALPSHLPCRQCKGDHPIYKCPEYAELNIAGRKAMVYRLRLCYNCLREGHDVARCSAGACVRCPNKQKHNSSICPMVNTANRASVACGSGTSAKAAKRRKREAKSEAKSEPKEETD